MAYIYQIQNDVNGKLYIGKTEFSIEKRFKEHCRDALKSRNEKRPLYEAMRKYGIEHFHILLIEETNEPEEREKFWIEYLGTFKNGYNATIGGDGKAYIDYELVISLYRRVKNEREVARILKISHDQVGKILRTKIPGEILDSGKVMKAKKSRPVGKIDLNTGEIIETYSSVREAEIKNNIQRHIGKVCLGKRKTAGGFGWEYL